MRNCGVAPADDCKPSAETHWLSVDPVDYANEFAPMPLSSAEKGKPPTRFFAIHGEISVQDGARLMVMNGSDARIFCPGKNLTNGSTIAADYFARGSLAVEEISRADAEALALKIGARLTDFGVEIVPLAPLRHQNRFTW